MQRLWSALLLIVAYEGTRYVGRALGAGPGAGVLAGLVYALSPRLLGAVGVLSGEILPSAVLPWAVLPLVLARSGRLSPRQAGLWCGVAVLCMSGVNGAGVLAVVPLLAMLALTGGRRLAGWWLAGMAASCAWWALPLVLLGRYSPPFLDFIETSTATTSSTGWSNSVRGDDHWLAYFSLGDQPWWPGAHLLATNPVLVAAAGVVAALGWFGLAHREMPSRGPLLASALVGLLCLVAGSPSVVGSMVDGPVRDLLDGALAPLRNVHKIDPVVRLPLALGFGHAATLLLRRFPRATDGRRWSSVVLVTAVLLMGAPLAADDMRMPGYDSIPHAWEQTAEYLADQPDSRALVLPGTGFGLQSWGWTVDEPMQGVATSPWVTRSQVPLVPGPTARYLDTIERRIASGEGGSGLADLLARGGITHVVLRRDLDTTRAETVPVERAETALVASAGLTRVAGFGRTGYGEQALIEVYAVDDPLPEVSLADARSLVGLDGAPDDVLTALETGAIQRDTPVEVTDRGAGARRVVTDGYTRVERQFGRVHEAVSAVKSREEQWLTDRPSPDYPGVPGVGRSTSEVLANGIPALDVTASSSQGYADEIGSVRPEFGPQSAFDGNGATEWRSGSFQPPDDQWLDVDLDQRVTGGVLEAQFEFQNAARVSRVRVRAWTAEGETDTVYGLPDSGLLLAPLPRAQVDRIRLEVVSTRPDPGGTDQVRLSEVTLPGLATVLSRWLPDPVHASDTVVMRLDPPRRACVDLGLGPQCQQFQARPGESDGRLTRTFDTTGSGFWELSGSVVAAPGPASAALLAPSESTLRVRTGSTLAGDPAVAGAFAMDGDIGTSWLTGTNQQKATLRIRWQGQREITGLSVVGSGSDSVRPTTAELRSGGVTRTVPLDVSTQVEPFLASGHLRVTFTRPHTAGSTGRPMGLSEMRVQGLEPLVLPLDLTARTGAFCGLGPEVRVDGRVHATEVDGTMDDVRLGRPLGWRVCDGPVPLTAGQHFVDVLPTAQFQPVELGWHPTAGATDLPTEPDRTMSVRHWGDTDREVDVGSGGAAILRVAENTNEGWRATLDGRTLQEVPLDGWQQGYLVPAGQGGRVRLSFTPDATYRAGLLGGLLLAGLLVAAAAALQVRERRRPVPHPVPVADQDPHPPGLWAGAAAGIGLLVLGGPVAFVAYLVAAPRRLRQWAPWWGAAAVAASAFAAALAGTGGGAPGAPADSLAAGGVGLLVGGALLAGRKPLPVVSARARWAAVRSGVAKHAVLLAGTLLLAVQAVVRWQLAAGSWFWQDDFLHLDLSRTLGLSHDYLVRDYSGHVEPGQYVAIWAIGQLGHGSFGPAVVVLVLLQALASLLLLVLLQLIFGRSPWLLVPFAAYLFTPLSLATAGWLAAGLQAYPLQVAMLTALIGLVQLDGTGRWRWGVLSVAGQVLGLACWEKAVLVLPLLLAVDALVLARGLSTRARLRRLRRSWPLWAAHVFVLAGYVGFYVAVTNSGGVGDQLDQGLVPTLHDVVLRTLLPGMFGGPWTARGAGNTIYADTGAGLQVLFVALTLGMVAVSVWLRGRSAWAGWALLVGYLAADIALLLLGRGSYLLLVARDPRYVTDALPVLTIGVCAAFRRPAHTISYARGRALRPTVALVLAVVVAASGLLTTVRLAPAVQHDESKRYVDTLASQLQAAPVDSVLSTPVPPDVSVAVSLPSLLRATWHEQALDRPGEHPTFVTPDGRLVPADLVTVDLSLQGPSPGCGWGVGADGVTLGDASVGEGEQLLRLHYVAGGAGVLHVSLGGVEQAVEYHAGLGTAYFATTGQSGPIRAWADRSGLCLSDLQRGQPGVSGD